MSEAGKHATSPGQLAEEPFREMANALPLIVWMHDAVGEQILVNDRFCEFFGVAGEEMKGSRWQVLTHLEELEAYVGEFLACVRARRPFHREVRVKRADGQWRWLESWARSRFDDSGECYGLVGVSADVTERKQAEAAQVAELRESKERFRSMAETAPAMIWATSPDGFCSFLSRSWYQHTGLEENAGLGFGWLDAVHPDDRVESQRIFMQAHQKRVPFSVDYRLRTADGSYRWALDAGRPRFGGQGEFVGHTGSVIDIHERKQAEAEVRRAQDLIESITEGTDDLIAAEDLCFRFTYFNQSYFREFKKLWGQEITIGTDMVAALAPWPEQQRKARELWGRAMAGESFHVEMSFGPSPDKLRVYDLRFSPIRDASGEVTGAAHIFRDVTERARFDETLRRSEAKFRSVFEQAAIGMGRVSFDDLRWIDVNDRFCEMLGYSRRRLLDTAWPEMTHPDDVDLDLIPFQEMAAGKLESYSVEKRFVHAHGHYVWARLTLSLVRDAEGRPDYEIAIIEDISDRKRAEHELCVANEQLLDSSRRKDEYLAMLGHELRNPLAAIHSATELVKQMRSGNDRLDRAADILARQSEHMARLLDGLLDVSRIARGKIELHCRVLDLRRLCEQVLDDRKESVSKQGLQLDAQLPAAPVWIFGDSVRLVQVLDNLLGNAVKFTPPPGRIELELDEDGSCAVLRVRDTGIGIRAEKLEEMFEPFYQEPSERLRKNSGLGLGLALSKGLVELHHGSISALSEGLGSGTQIVVELPVAEAPDQPAEVLAAVTP